MSTSLSNWISCLYSSDTFHCLCVCVHPLRSVTGVANAIDINYILSKHAIVPFNKETHCGFFVVHLSEWQPVLTTWQRDRQDNPSLISLAIMRFGSFWDIASSHCPFHPCLAHVLSSLEAVSWMLLTPKVACTWRRPISMCCAKFHCLLFPFFLLLLLSSFNCAWSCFSPGRHREHMAVSRFWRDSFY